MDIKSYLQFKHFYRAFYPGIIFKVFDSSKVYFMLKYDTKIIFQNYYTDGVLDYSKENYWSNYDSGMWTYGIFRITQNNAVIYIYCIRCSGSVTNGEFRMDSVNSTFMIGS